MIHLAKVDGDTIPSGLIPFDPIPYELLQIRVPCRDGEQGLIPLDGEHATSIDVVIHAVCTLALTHLTWEEVHPFYDWLMFSEDNASLMTYEHVPVMIEDDLMNLADAIRYIGPEKNIPGPYQQAVMIFNVLSELEGLCPSMDASAKAYNMTRSFVALENVKNFDEEIKKWIDKK